MMLTPRAAAVRIGVSSSLIYQLCKQGVLRHFRFGGKNKRGKLMIDEADLAAFIDRCRREPAPPAHGLKHISLG
jgi:excisionase family DNA binding protein